MPRPGPRPFNERPDDRAPAWRDEPRSGPDRRPPLRPALADAEHLEPGEELVAGRRPVEEAFAARRQALRLLVTPGRRQALERIVLHATTLRIPIVEVEGGSLTAIAGFDGHQGVALVVAPRRFSTPDEILARAIERGEPPFVLVLDSLEDPQNLGTVLRSAEAAGVHGVLFPTQRQAPLSPAAVKASAGATEHLLLAPVEDLAAALTDLHVRGVRVVGSEADAPLTVREADLRGPVAIVVGSEGHGLSPTVRRRCDLMVRIPMRGAIGSLNAAVAGSVLLFEALGQRHPDARPGVPAATSVGAAETAQAATQADGVSPAPTDVDSSVDPDAPSALPAPGPTRRRRRAASPAAEPSAQVSRVSIQPADGAAEPVAEMTAEAAPEPIAGVADGAPAEPARSPRPRRRVPKPAAISPEASPDAASDVPDPELLPGEAPAVPSAASDPPSARPAAARRRRSGASGSA